MPPKHPDHSSYVIISPVKDEEQYVELTLQSVIAQTVKPLLWIIVDDGSKDRTAEIVKPYVATHPFIRLVQHPDAGSRKLGSSEVRAFNFGLTLVCLTDYHFVVKLDCDLSFGPDYFDLLLEQFTRHERLGIASGIYLEPGRAGRWEEVVMPPYHAAGASKMIRRVCFEDIGGFTPAPGWDTVDELRAISRGWTTAHFRDITMKHHKHEGSTIGPVNTSIMQGEAYYRSGGSALFFVFKLLHRVVRVPYLVSALGLLWGYMRATLRRAPILVTETEASCYKALLLGRLKSKVHSLLRAD
jgi:glycosyltransferase involved in cell wall biosynthesis